MQPCRFCGEVHRIDELCRARRVNRRTFFGVFAAGVAGMAALPSGWMFDPLAVRAETITLAAERAGSRLWISSVPLDDVGPTLGRMTTEVRRVYHACQPILVQREGRTLVSIGGLWRFDGGYARLCPARDFSPGGDVTPALDPVPIACSPSAHPPDSPIRD
jgi:hypothetical protein